LGTNWLVGDHVPSVYVVDGPNSGQATGVAGGFANISSIQGGTSSDQFTVTDTGSLDGLLFGSEGDDIFQVTPAVGSSLTISGGLGQDTLIVDPGAGDATVLPGMVTIAPGGAVVNYSDTEQVMVASSMSASLASRLFAPAPSDAVGHHTSSDGVRMGFLDLLPSFGTDRNAARRRRTLKAELVDRAMSNRATAASDAMATVDRLFRDAEFVDRVGARR
jgi:hypothetical protein